MKLLQLLLENQAFPGNPFAVSLPSSNALDFLLLLVAIYMRSSLVESGGAGVGAAAVGNYNRPLFSHDSSL